MTGAHMGVIFFNRCVAVLVFCDNIDLVRSPFKLNRPKKALLFPRENDAELEFPLLNKLWGDLRRIFCSESGILVRLRSRKIDFR